MRMEEEDSELLASIPIIDSTPIIADNYVLKFEERRKN
jgi:hypothetical protein